MRAACEMSMAACAPSGGCSAWLLRSSSFSVNGSAAMFSMPPTASGESNPAARRFARPALLGRGLRPGAADREAGPRLEVDVRQYFLLGELERRLPVARGELLVAPERVEHVLRHFPDQLFRPEVLLSARRKGERHQAGQHRDRELHAVALSFALFPLNMPGSREWRSRSR